MSKQKQYPKLWESAKFSIIENVTILKESLGRGSYGTVYAALYDDKACVVKEMHPYLQHVNRNKHAPVELVFEEINILSSLRHPSIVQFLGVHFVQDNFSTDSSIPIMVMERMWKSLWAVFEDHRKQLSLVNKVHILHDIACGLQYLHTEKPPIVHRDLNANNILLNENLTAKIGDLGQARTLELVNDKERLSTAPGNTLHMPPEALVHKPEYDSSLDVFSFGCITVHTATEKLPIPSDPHIQVGTSKMFIKRPEAQRRQEYLDLMNDYSVLQTIAIQCLEDAPKDRPTASHICDRLLQYIKQLETELPLQTEQHKQSKLSLIHSNEELNKEMKTKYEKNILEKDESISILKQQLHDTKDKVEQDKEASEKEKDSLEMKLAEQDEMIRESSRIYQQGVDRLRKELEISRVTHTQLQKETNDLQEKLKYEESNHQQKVTDLQTKLKLADDKIEIEQLNFQKEQEILQKRLCEQRKLNDQLLLDKDKLSIEVANKIQKFEHERECLQKKLKEEESNNQIQMDKLRSKQEQLQKDYCTCKQEKDAIQKKLDEQINHQILMDRLRENEKAELSEANRQIQKLQNKLQHKAADLEVFQKKKKIIKPGSTVHQKILEIDSTHRDERSSFLATIELQKVENSKLHNQLSEVREKSFTQKQQLEEKSRCLSTLEMLLDESHSKELEEKMKLLGEENALLKQQLENNDRIQRNFEKDLKGKEESLKRKEEELQLQKKEHAKEINNLQNQYERKLNDLNEDINMYKSQVVSQEETGTLLKKEAEFQADLEKSTKNRFQNLENERKKLVRSEKSLRKQIKHKEAENKEKDKQIKSLELSSETHPKEHNFDIRWYPYISLPVKKIRPSVTMIKDRVFVTSGYQSTSPQGRELQDYLQAVEDRSNVFCFHLAKCQCDTIASPVQLGALASVNGQCVLVSGADSVGNTLTGNVYVLCEEGSHDQWKEFSKPLPTPRILACACCYGNKWLIVCGGFACRPKEESSLLEAVNVLEILDTTKDKWYTLSEKDCPNFSTILCCSVVGEDLYVVGSNQVIKTSCNKLIKAATSNDILVWDNVETEESNGKLYPFSVVEVNGEPMIIASMSDGEDDVTCVLMKDTRGRWRIMSKAVECQHCSAAVMTSSLELLLFGGSEKIIVDEANDIAYKGSLIPTLDIQGE